MKRLISAVSGLFYAEPGMLEAELIPRSRKKELKFRKSKWLNLRPEKD